MVDIEQTLKYISREEEEKQAELLAKKYNLPYINLMDYPILPDVLNIIPEDIAKKERMVAYLRLGQEVRVAVNNPASSSLKDAIKKIEDATKYQISVAVCSNSSYRYALTLYRLFPASSATKQNVEVSKEEAKEFQYEIKNLQELKNKLAKVSTTEVLDVIFAGAIALESSDIHLEPRENQMVIRFRIDGILQDIVILPMSVHKALISRIKYLAKLKLDVTDKPQDGRFDATIVGRKVDVRVSSLPTAYGEAMSMRLLQKESKFIKLEELGFSPRGIQTIREAITKPNGIIFNTGPTGSGKTTTLYAILSELNKPGVKIITLEDPIEYRIPGIEQSQVNQERGYDFAIGLRSILRQDPDIIMVGEIRDQDTATTSIHAAMTGHLVLTTLHTNSAPAAIPRLLDMGVKPYLLGGTINLIIAQRLVRKVCKKCQGKGCEICNMTGYKGRIAISELLVPTREIEDLISKNASVREFEEAAKRAGMVTMEEDGMQKVKEGLTTKEEVLRVIK